MQFIKDWNNCPESNTEYVRDHSTYAQIGASSRVTTPAEQPGTGSDGLDGRHHRPRVARRVAVRPACVAHSLTQLPSALRTQPSGRMPRRLAARLYSLL